MFPNKVKILRGKFKDKVAYWQYYVEKHPLSSETRSQIRVYSLPYTPHMKTILINESGFEVLTWKDSL